MTNDNQYRWLMLLVGLWFAAPALALTDADVASMKVECEAKRQEALAPARAQKIQSCIEQESRDKAYCERYYSTYGNVSSTPGGAPQGGHFYNLPECQAWLQAKEALKASRSRP
jgi:hypothetical protein